MKIESSGVYYPPHSGEFGTLGVCLTRARNEWQLFSVYQWGKWLPNRHICGRRVGQHAQIDKCISIITFIDGEFDFIREKWFANGKTAAVGIQ